MRKSFYVLLAMFAMIIAITTGCGKSEEQKAAERAHADSVRIADSTRHADSIFKIQTADMLLADSLMERRSDSLQRATALARLQSQQSKLAFINRVMNNYISTLNEGGNPSNALGEDVSNSVLAALTAANGGPSVATDSTGRKMQYVLLGISHTDENDWFACAWKKGDKKIFKTIKVGMNVNKFRLDSIK